MTRQSGGSAVSTESDNPLVDLDDSVPHRIEREVGDRMQVELAHEVGAVSLCGLDAEAESGSDLLSSLTLRDQLNYLPFPRGQHILAGRVTFFMRAQVAIEHHLSDFGSEK